MTVFGLLFIFILLGIAAGAGIYLYSKLTDIISSIIVRQLLSALLFLTIIFGLPWLGITLLFGEMLYPVGIQKINDEYRYSQQGYEFATTSSQGYDFRTYALKTLYNLKISALCKELYFVLLIDNQLISVSTA